MSKIKTSVDDKYSSDIFFDCHQDCLAMIEKAISKIDEEERLEFYVHIGPAIAAAMLVSLGQIAPNEKMVLEHGHKFLDKHYDYCKENGTTTGMTQ